VVYANGARAQPPNLRIPWANHPSLQRSLKQLTILFKLILFICFGVDQDRYARPLADGFITFLEFAS
jgi:hypothetical protein